KRMVMDLLLDMLFGSTSSNYLSLYDSGLIDDSFSYEYSYEDEFDFVAVGGDSKKPTELSDAIKDILLGSEASDELNEEHFRLVKKRTIGELLQALNSPEYMANQFFDFYYDDATLFDLVPIVESITLDDVKTTAASYMKENVMTVFQVLPSEEN